MFKQINRISGTLLVAILMATSPLTTLANDIQVRFNGNYVDISPSPIIIDGRTLVPARAITEMLGATVTWDDLNSQVNIVLGTTHIQLTIDSNIAIVNNTEMTLDVPAKIIDDRTFVPMRFIAESLGLHVDFRDGVVVVLSEIVGLLAGPVLEWLADSKQVREYRGESTMAFLVDIDGNGTQGILAIRHDGPSEWPFAVAKVFYLRGDEVLYKDLGTTEGFPFAVRITAERRLIIVGGDAGTRSYTLFAMENGELVFDFTILRRPREPRSDYFLLPGGISGYNLANYEDRIPITEEEFYDTVMRHGLDNRGLTQPITQDIIFVLE